jgi:hypothetical protein
MSNIIHMDTDKVRETATLIIQGADQLERQVQTVSSAIMGIPWEGPIREQFVNETSALVRALLHMAEQGRILGSRLQREVDEWQTVDQQYANNYASIGTIVAGWWEGINSTWQDLRRWIELEKAKREFKEWWNGLTAEQRLDYLNQQHEKIAKKYGFPPIKVKVEDIKDPFGKDSQGYNSGTEIVIDSDNLNFDDPRELMDTIAHESRH